jgi:hypothetical protein
MLDQRATHVIDPSAFTTSLSAQSSALALKIPIAIVGGVFCVTGSRAFLCPCRNAASEKGSAGLCWPLPLLRSRSACTRLRPPRSGAGTHGIGK